MVQVLFSGLTLEAFLQQPETKPASEFAQELQLTLQDLQTWLLE
ncbi:MAG TPA: hypothetical protein V6C64_11740 [Microcoleaceae cyanobacterium]|jgi:hypothetical protein